MTDDNDIDHLDSLIDDVAQAMTTSTPGGPAGDGFARRVSMRIAESGGRRQSWLRPWVLVPLAAAIVLFVLVRLKPDPTVLRRPDASPVVTNETVRPKPDTTDDVRPKDVRLKPDATNTGATNTAATYTAAAPLARIEPAALAPIEIDPIAIEPLVETNAVQITPIAIDRIEIFPMP